MDGAQARVIGHLRSKMKETNVDHGQLKQLPAMTECNVLLSGLFIVLAAASSTAAQSVIEKEKFDVEKARVYLATVLPHHPVLARDGHASNRVFIYMDDGVMTRREGEGPVRTIAFHRGDIGWIAASSGYVSENTTDRPVRILIVDLKATPSGPAAVAKLDPAIVDPAHYTIVLDNDQVRVLRIHFEPHDKGQRHEHSLDRIVAVPKRPRTCEGGRRAHGWRCDPHRGECLGAACRSNSRRAEVVLHSVNRSRRFCLGSRNRSQHDG